MIIQNLNAYTTWQEANILEIKDSVTIVIDVLRASNTIITALSKGAASIIPVSEINRAWEIKKDNPHYLLGGERNAVKINGFDFGNSPLEYTADKISNKTIIFTTANGTRALEKVHVADKVFVGSFLNAKYIANEVVKYKKNLSIVCAGTLANPSLEDSLAAGKIIAELLKHIPLTLNDFASLCLGAYQNNKDDLFKLISTSTNGKRLIQLGKPEDIRYCTLEDSVSILPMYDNKKIRVFS